MIYTVLVYTAPGFTPHVVYRGRWGQFAHALYGILGFAWHHGADVAHMVKLRSPVIGIDLQEQPAAVGV